MAENGLNKPPSPTAEEQRQRLLNKQEAHLAALARKFLDDSKPAEALALVKNSKGFSWTNLVTLIGVQIAESVTLGNEAKSLFAEYIKKAGNFAELMLVLLYVKNPRRSFLPDIFASTVEARLRELKPEWDGAIDTSAKDQMDAKIELHKLPMEEITDLATCLDLAAIGKPAQRKKYLARFLELGGSAEDEKYLKITLNNILLGIESTKDARTLVQALAKKMHPLSFRKWVRSNSKKSSSDKKFRVPASFSRMVLASYIAADPEQLDATDWLYIGERSVELQEMAVQRICFEYLKKMPRDEKMQKVLNILMRRFAVDTGVETSAADKQLANPIYEQLGSRAPVNKAAAMAVARWAEEALKEKE